MATVIIIAACAFISGCMLFISGWRMAKSSVVEFSDVLKANAKRSDIQVMQDAIMQLKNEIAESGAIKKEKLENGDIKVSIKVLT